MSEIRITYSGLISFVIGLAGVFIGTIFTFIITRTLNPIEFGTWSLINNLFVYMIIIEPVISYWATREIARGIESGKTSILSSGVLSIGGIFGYCIIAYFVGHQTHVNQNALFLAGILIPLIFLNRTLGAINLGWKPHAVSYGALFFGITEIPSALIFVYFLHMGVVGVIITTLIAYMTSIAILLVYARDKISNKIRRDFLKKWLKLSWLPLYPAIQSTLSMVDVVIFSVITGSVIGLAFWSAASSIPILVANSALIARAVYAKLLQEKSSEYLKENFTHLLYFAIPLVALCITFARPTLFALNPVYEIAVPVVIFVTIRVFLNTLSTVFQSFLIGIEKVDVYEASTFRDYVKSKLFFMPTIMTVQYGVYISLFVTILVILKPYDISQIDLVIYWSIIALITQIPFTIYLYVLVRRNFTFSLDKIRIGKYLLVSVIVFGITYLITQQFLDYKNNLFIFIGSLLLLVGLGIGSYLLITYAVDFKTRKLFKAMIKEIKEKKSST